MTAPERARMISVAIIKLAVQAQREPGEGLAAVMMAAASALLAGNATHEKCHAMLDSAIAAVKPELTALGVLPS